MKVAPWVVVLLGACSVSRPTFECADDDWSRCGPGGACEPGTGSCSFPDTSCTTGRRFSELASSMYADTCVPLKPMAGRRDLCETSAACTDARKCVGERCVSVDAFSSTEDFTCAECAAQVGGVTVPQAVVCWGPSTLLSARRPEPLQFNTYDCYLDAPMRINCPTECADCTNCPRHCLGAAFLDSISVGGNYFCYDNSKTLCAGENDTHQTGFPTAGPVAFWEPPEHYSLIAAGTNHTCGRPAVISNAIDCWGETTDGQLGVAEVPSAGSTGTAVRSLPFPSNPNVVTILQIAIGRRFTCAGSDDDRVRCWGAVPGGAGFIGGLPTGGITGLDAGRDHACVLKGDRVLCWGSNEHGQAAPADPSSLVTVPVDVLPGITVVSIATGRDHSCAITEAGVIYCWGASDLEQLGPGHVGPGPVIVRADPPAAGPVNAGANVTCAIHADDRVRCWGDVFQVGDDRYDDFEICQRGAPPP